MKLPSKEKSQIERFKATAKEAECDESEDAFDTALRRIAKAPLPPEKKPQKPKP